MVIVFCVLIMYTRLEYYFNKFSEYLFHSGRSQMTAMNGKRPSSIPSRHQSETVAQHFDLIKYIYDCKYRILILFMSFKLILYIHFYSLEYSIKGIRYVSQSTTQ